MGSINTHVDSRTYRIHFTFSRCHRGGCFALRCIHQALTHEPGNA